MANIASQKKRAELSATQNIVNNSKRSRVKTAIKKYENAVNAKDVELAKSLLPLTISIIDKAKSDGIYKANTASRKVARLSKLYSTLLTAQ
ncbi:MAG: 30S ribosomal protein S20 [Christensenellaceae bacterium]|jgi:small subunit ribosomal protein S20|nr:30S ribosomal protein S20 [Christensenellaceae bacterium]